MIGRGRSVVSASTGFEGVGEMAGEELSAGLGAFGEGRLTIGRDRVSPYTKVEEVGGYVVAFRGMIGLHQLYLSHRYSRRHRHRRPHPPHRFHRLHHRPHHRQSPPHVKGPRLG
jgi:hypothetical protein